MIKEKSLNIISGVISDYSEEPKSQTIKDKSKKLHEKLNELKIPHIINLETGNLIFEEKNQIAIYQAWDLWKRK